VDAAADFRMLELHEIAKFHRDRCLRQVTVALSEGNGGHARALERLGRLPICRARPVHAVTIASSAVSFFLRSSAA